ncbi:MAG: tryptophan transporter [Peptostreptococcaceae bacterium]|nr:tryptophan transporter [Peptostreptococcaceae bacterium]
MKNLVGSENVYKVSKSNSDFSTKSLALSGVLIAIGFVLHSIVPPLFFGIKPDFLLACLFVAVASSGNFKNVLTAGIVAGIISALTTNFPAGQIPSLFDKTISAVAVYFLLMLMPKFSSLQQIFVFGAITFVGTIISGMVFLGSAFAIAGLPAPFLSLVVGIVLPTALVNVFFGMLMFKIQRCFVR